MANIQLFTDTDYGKEIVDWIASLKKEFKAVYITSRLGVSTSMVSKWRRKTKTPSDLVIFRYKILRAANWPKSIKEN